MRWDNLRVDSAEDGHRLPGYSDPAVVRTFNAPEALDVRFYEVHARSALNRVPKRSRMPFEWTVNPYRGCSHACVYCLAGDTPILMADGRTKTLADVRIGDRIYGTVRRGYYRRYVLTEVQAHWSTIKPAYRITLEDGTELVASGDHRFLTERGWKHVTNNDRGVDRAHLTINNSLLGTGQFAAASDDSPEYRRGYLCGMIRGDAHLDSYSYTRAGRQRDDHHRFRLALTDFEALRRARTYLAELQIATRESEFPVAMAGARPMRMIRTSAGANVAAIRELVAWPTTPTTDWRKGFLAGIFDAEGSYLRGIIRIGNTDDGIIRFTAESFRRFGFSFAIEDAKRANGLRCVRLLGGIQEHLRFFHTVDPAITRKRSIEGTAIKTRSRLKVVSIESVGAELPLYDITTGTGDFIANGVVSHNCFARPTHTYLDMNAGRDFEREIVVKVNAPEVLRAELRRPSWKREHVAMGTNTDPYQWVEGRYRLMPGIWEALRDSRTPSSILTKSPLLLRDTKLMLEAAEHAPVAANLSVPTLDEGAWRETEPHTPSPRARLQAVAELNRAGIPTGVLIAPLMPGINDRPEEVERILELADEAGATNVGGVALHLRGEVRGLFMDWLRDRRPDLVPRYEELYRRGTYAPTDERKRLGALVRRDNGPRSRPPPGRPLRGIGPAGPASRPESESASRQNGGGRVQGSLF
ncbi:MAG: intein-containing Rv2578c family radical SAM protein [Thermoleophilaceae bacterium]|nr:intein-containing Rv2578c family radical SAM protein [Thermoleophilaceae bacterium]